MFKKMFKKKGYEIPSPMSGKILSIEEVPDQVFSEKMVGDGFAVEPTNGKVYSPVNGTVAQIFPTKHAIGIVDEKNIEILIHVGIDTVELKGEGFEAFVEKGDKVTRGQILLEVDLESVKSSGKSTITPIVFTDKTQYQSIDIKPGDCDALDVVCEIRK